MPTVALLLLVGLLDALSEPGEIDDVLRPAMIGAVAAQPGPATPVGTVRHDPAGRATVQATMEPVRR